MSFRWHLAAFLFPLCGIVGAQDFDPVLAARLQWKVDSIRDRHGVQGVSASVLLPGAGLWRGTAGFSHAGVPITTDMAFGIASNTKTFTGSLLARLHQVGIIGLDDPLSTWLPTYPNIDPAITVRQLLNHVSGVEDVNRLQGYPDSILTDPDRVFSPEELMAWVGPPRFAPGTDWSYSNTNYLLAGMVAERATGRSYGDLLRDSILVPLGLDSTWLEVFENGAPDLAYPWQNGTPIGGLPRTSLNSAAGAAGAMCSTSGEMARWYQALMGGWVLGPAAFAGMTTFVGSGEYGLGLGRMLVQGRVCYGHGGDIRGYRSTLLFDTASQVIVCVLVNANPAPAPLIAQELLLTAVRALPTGLGRHALSAPDLVLRPNPVRDLLQVDLPGHRPSEVTVHAVTGAVLLRGTGPVLYLGSLAPGTYVVAIRTDHGVAVRRVVKE